MPRVRSSSDRPMNSPATKVSTTTCTEYADQSVPAARRTAAVTTTIGGDPHPPPTRDRLTAEQLGQPPQGRGEGQQHDRAERDRKEQAEEHGGRGGEQPRRADLVAEDASDDLGEAEVQGQVDGRGEECLPPAAARPEGDPAGGSGTAGAGQEFRRVDVIRGAHSSVR